jgi:hypothetical protein
MAQLSLDAVRSVNPGINEHDLIEWFMGGALIASIPDWAKHTLRPLLTEAGFDETEPIHVHRHEGTPGVTLYQEPGERQVSPQSTGTSSASA